MPIYNQYQNYQPYYPQYQQAVQQPMQQPIQQPIQQPQIQNGGLISVRSVDEAKNWPVAPGNSVTFKDEATPYVYVKTMGFSQLDRPSFEVFRLVKEEETIQQQPQIAVYATKDELTALKNELSILKGELSAIRDGIEKARVEIEENEVKG